MYRTSARRGAPDTVVVCRACGVRANVRLEEARLETFACTRCATEQPVLRAADDVKLGTVALVGQQGAEAYAELVPLVQSLGGSGKVYQVTLECDGIRLLVALSLNSGTVQGVDFAAPAPGLPDMVLLRETMVHRDAKSRGLVREAQTGDAAFDEAVYIESKVRDEDVRTVLAAPAVRFAVTKLLEVADRVEIDGGHVKLYVSKERDAFNPAAIHEQLAWLRVVAGATRPIVAEDAPVPLAASIAKVATYFFAPVGLAVGILGGSTYGPIGTRPYVIGIAVGLVLAAVVHPAFRRALRGRSTSHKDILAARIASLVFLPFFATGALIIYNGAVDRSPERAVVMKVVSTSVDDDDSSKIHAKTVDDEGQEHSYTFVAPTPTTPARVHVKWRSGALGWKWESGPASLTVEGPRP